MNWEEVCQRSDLIGGELFWIENGQLYRGPLASIEIRDGLVRMKHQWLAIPMSRQVWQSFGSPFHIIFSARTVQPRTIDHGGIAFNAVNIGSGKIYPRGYNQLDPKQVVGLHL